MVAQYGVWWIVFTIPYLYCISQMHWSIMLCRHTLPEVSLKTFVLVSYICTHVVVRTVVVHHTRKISSAKCVSKCSAS